MSGGWVSSKDQIQPIFCRGHWSSAATRSLPWCMAVSRNSRFRNALRTCSIVLCAISAPMPKTFRSIRTDRHQLCFGRWASITDDGPPPERPAIRRRRIPSIVPRAGCRPWHASFLRPMFELRQNGRKGAWDRAEPSVKAPFTSTSKKPAQNSSSRSTWKSARRSSKKSRRSTTSRRDDAGADLHGDADELVPLQQSEIIIAKLKDTGVPARRSSRRGRPRLAHDPGRLRDSRRMVRQVSKGTADGGCSSSYDRTRGRVI